MQKIKTFVSTENEFASLKDTVTKRGIYKKGVMQNYV